MHTYFLSRMYLVYKFVEEDVTLGFCTQHFLLSFADIVSSDSSAIRISEAELRTGLRTRKFRLYRNRIKNDNCASISDTFFTVIVQKLSCNTCFSTPRMITIKSRIGE